MVKQAGGALLLSIDLDHRASRPISTQLCIALRDIILAGGLKAGDRLPATRTLAKDLSLSRTTVVEVFERLVAEGLVESRTGAGTFVSQVLGGDRTIAKNLPSLSKPRRGRGPRLSRRFARVSKNLFQRLPHESRAFTTALPAFDAFPMALWSRFVAKHWRAHRDVVMGYGDPHGFLPLRRAIAAHLRANRGLSCEPEQVFIVNGAQEAFHLISGILLDPGDKVWFENPGAIGARNSLVAAGVELIPVPVDDEGLMVEVGRRKARSFRLAFVTPSHQQPLGSTMSLERRFALLRAAEEADAWIIEDDYDGEFRYSGHPLPTLESVDTSGRVIYVGTFSKSMFPALRIGYFIAPPSLFAVLETLTSAFFSGVPSNPQAVLADFMEEGHFATHVRRMRKIYAERYQVLYEASRRRLAGLLEVIPTDTGLHTIGRLPPDLPERLVAKMAMEHGITVAPIELFSIAPCDTKGLVLGFSGIRPHEIEAGVDVLAEVLEGISRRKD